MAISHIGRVLLDRAERKIAALGQEALGGGPQDFSAFRYLQGVAEGIKWAIQQIEDIESERSS